jgi:hypothetical protein
VGQSVSYGIGLVEGETSFEYNYQWGRGGEESRESSVALQSGVEMIVNPGTKIKEGGGMGGRVGWVDGTQNLMS